MTNDTSELRRLNESERPALDAGLALAAKLAGSETALSLEQVQALYDRALESSEPDDERDIAIGLALGALIVDGTEFEWARISDRWGDETCVAVVGKMVHAAPISMVQKRLRRAERVDLFELKDGTVGALREQAMKAADRDA
jgi:hypothetical protein